jgi:DedD protein
VAKAASSASAAEPKTGRFVVQVGAFADATAARDVRLKVERLGLKTYTQVVDTEGGKRTRVRIGPFESREDANKVLAKLKTVDLPGAVLTL